MSFSIHTGVNSLEQLFARLNGDERDRTLELKTQDELHEIVKYPATIEALLVDPFDMTTRMVELPLEKEEEDSVSTWLVAWMT